MENQLERIKSKLIERLENYNGYVIKGRTLQLNPPVPVQKIHDFEKKYNIKLPAELVAFYTQVSNGALLYPDEDICNLYTFEEWSFNENLINKDFTVENDLEYDDFCELLKNDSNPDFLDYGSITLMDLGCAMTYEITVKGKHYGEVWGNFEMWLLLTRQNFLDWLEACIDGKAENVFI